LEENAVIDGLEENTAVAVANVPAGGHIRVNNKFKNVTSHLLFL
jgi:hypothetical protein